MKARMQWWPPPSLLGSDTLAQPVISQNGGPMRADENAELTALEVWVNDQLAKHYIRHRGAEDPASIPYSSKMNIFFDRVRGRHSDPAVVAHRLQQRITLEESDVRLLAEVILAEEQPQALRSITEQILKLHAQLEQLTELTDAIDIGKRENALHEAATAAWSAHVEAQLAPLSREGRRTLDEYVNREVAPKMTHVRIDYAALYTEVVQLAPLIKRLQAKGFLQVPEAVAAAYAAARAVKTAATPEQNR